MDGLSKISTNWILGSANPMRSSMRASSYLTTFPRRVEMAELEGRVTHLPATWAMIVTRFAEVGFLFGLIEVSGPP